MAFVAIAGSVANMITIMDIKTKRILFIDDETHVRQIVKACLESLGGWDVLLAASGQEGLSKAVSEQPDAILLDLMMPEMDGLVLLKKLQANSVTQSIPVVFLTARKSLTEPQKFQELGVKGAIAKPFNSMTLVPQIANALGWNTETQSNG
ncbi:response regulator receiver domain protein [Planktothrix agardhii CCAP 1459/11A]|jgi:CheY-like chemotaxis protein|uniref:Response regulator receiver domain protein n=3 Tax=Microcoleaceae TaxID=1892252 RepID=A0A479ZUD7_PLAAG|nr:response regulator receiver domain protein [Planktothrix agardhii CCAP 1459/11A]CAC5342794.1 Response regulator containing a CheY-like receiver domain and an HD-GYP domain [Planktothrix rubescens NIVA-CYA 18]CAD5971954.1 putative transcriptional regulator ycf27 [Planktothrix rubescens]CAD5973328.1 putative transcriptional regulator ycf27 [Planktothrix rubescens NIVA-CYA 18]CAH2574486.1 putative transcriptional regulator ycf27 [Planktothrix rubescens]